MIYRRRDGRELKPVIIAPAEASQGINATAAPGFEVEVPDATADRRAAHEFFTAGNLKRQSSRESAFAVTLFPADHGVGASFQNTVPDKRCVLEAGFLLPEPFPRLQRCGEGLKSNHGAILRSVMSDRRRLEVRSILLG